MERTTILQVVEDMDRLLKSLAALRNELAAENDQVKIIEVPYPDQDLLNELREMLIVLELRFSGATCEVKVGDIGKQYRNQSGKKVSDQKIGRVLRRLGLQARRTRIGFLMRWEKGSLDDRRAG